MHSIDAVIPVDEFRKDRIITATYQKEGSDYFFYELLFYNFKFNKGSLHADVELINSKYDDRHIYVPSDKDKNADKNIIVTEENIKEIAEMKYAPIGVRSFERWKGKLAGIVIYRNTDENPVGLRTTLKEGFAKSAESAKLPSDLFERLLPTDDNIIFRPWGRIEREYEKQEARLW